jgi:hypothetical protein
MDEPVTDVVSQRGWIKIDYGHMRWIPCLSVFPEGEDRQSWATGFAEAWWEASGLEHDKRHILGMARDLAAIHEEAYATLPCHMGLLHLPDPRLAPLFVGFGVWQARGDRESQLRRLVRVDDPGLVKLPIVDAITTPALGPGLRSLAYVRQGQTMIGLLNYAWRSEEHETALRVFTGSPDLGRLQRALPDIDELTAGITFIPR